MGHDSATQVEESKKYAAYVETDAKHIQAQPVSMEIARYVEELTFNPADPDATRKAQAESGATYTLWEAAHQGISQFQMASITDHVQAQFALNAPVEMKEYNFFIKII